MSILLIDPDAGFRERFVNLMLVSGFNNIETSSSIQDACQILSKSCYTVVLIDLFMPGMDGLHLARQIHNKQPSLQIYLLIEDKWQKVLNGGKKIRIEFPVTLKSFVDSQFLRLIFGGC